jgi:hypothetical protein
MKGQEVNLSTGLWVALSATVAPCAPAVKGDARGTVATGDSYRATFVRETMDFLLEMKGTNGEWHPAVKRGALTYAYFRGDESRSANGLRATWVMKQTEGALVVGQQAVLDADTGTVLDLHYVCTDEGILLGTRLRQRHFPPRHRQRDDLPATCCLMAPRRMRWSRMTTRR